MLPGAHTGVSYIISRILAKTKKVTVWDTVFLIFCGNAPDFDLFYIYFGKYPIYHHLLPTHTPIVLLILYGLGYLGYRAIYGKGKEALFLAGLVALMSHLVLDDFSYWLYLLGLATTGKPEIFWMYPWDSRMAEALRTYVTGRPGIADFVSCYTGHPVFIADMLLTVTGLGLFAKNLHRIFKKTSNG